ncbi:hypothetical protein FPOAC2_03894 [Fusarium poae]|uniref:hypothetical protein n=1 Tax=Fusarium poae TaxID=36050 RepID=UPI001CE95216|nr:hypothetical protein FPOAC1_003784 [Fusarium poae]KAG8677756.1 hypothetical protein FPOAC1_003784 [Fusarium poae]
MKFELFLSALLSAQVLAIPEPDHTVVKDGDFTYTGIDKPPAASKRVAIASQNAVDPALAATPANVNVLETMAAGHAVVVVCSASQDLVQESAGLNRHGNPIRKIRNKDPIYISNHTESQI